jgi:hypothetical protein
LFFGWIINNLSKNAIFYWYDETFSWNKTIIDFRKVCHLLPNCKVLHVLLRIFYFQLFLGFWLSSVLLPGVILLAISPSRLKIDPGRCPECDITLARHSNRWGKPYVCYPIKIVLSLFNFSKVNDCFISWKCFIIPIKYRIFGEIVYDSAEKQMLCAISLAIEQRKNDFDRIANVRFSPSTFKNVIYSLACGSENITFFQVDKSR